LGNGYIIGNARQWCKLLLQTTPLYKQLNQRN